MDNNQDLNLLPVQGIKLASTSAGIYKKQRNDVTLIQICEGSSVAAVFTKNVFAAAPVVVARKHLESEAIQYLLINAGNANAGLGKIGETDALQTCSALAEQEGCGSDAILPFSTGVIGEKLPVDKLIKVLPSLKDNLKTNNWQDAARAIMTTDTVEKAISTKIPINGKEITITGIAKGSGMIRPDMATMLAFIGTDAAVNTTTLQHILEETADATFNRITVDGDTSTNDACVLIATGEAGNKRIDDSTGNDYLALKGGVHEVCKLLAISIVKDGEGATKFIEINIKGGASNQECLQVGYAIAHSPLVKTAFFASDPNWGRILAAIGRAGVSNLDIASINIFLDEICIVEGGGRCSSYTEEQGKSIMVKPEITVTVELGRGNSDEKIWTCDLSHDYVSINADYRS